MKPKNDVIKWYYVFNGAGLQVLTTPDKVQALNLHQQLKAQGDDATIEAYDVAVFRNKKETLRLFDWFLLALLFGGIGWAGYKFIVWAIVNGVSFG